MEAENLQQQNHHRSERKYLLTNKKQNLESALGGLYIRHHARNREEPVKERNISKDLAALPRSSSASQPAWQKQHAHERMPSEGKEKKSLLSCLTDCTLFTVSVTATTWGEGGKTCKIYFNAACWMAGWLTGPTEATLKAIWIGWFRKVRNVNQVVLWGLKEVCGFRGQEGGGLNSTLSAANSVWLDLTRRRVDNPTWINTFLGKIIPLRLGNCSPVGWGGEQEKLYSGKQI